MATASTTLLLDALRTYRLLEPLQLEELKNLQGRFTDPKAFAGELIKRGWLTPYQANQLLQGRGQELVLGSYVLLERLGEGGMGQVFKARHRNLGRIVAVKLIRKERLDNPSAIKRFQREVRAAAALSHPNIVHAYDADEIAGTHLLVMECVEGATDLNRLVKKAGPLPMGQACEYIRQAALGLQHAYERGLVHRDIKPHNLLLTAEGKTVKVLDMGLARLDQPTEDDNSSTMTQEGAVMGTPDYIAPEQALDSHTVDIRADLYSLGCTFYFLLTGRVPFPGGTMMEKLMKHRLEEPKPVEAFRPDVPATVANVVRKLMAKKPGDRYQTPAEVAAALEAVGAASGTFVPPSGNDRTFVDGGKVAVEPKGDTFSSAFAFGATSDTRPIADSPLRMARNAEGRRKLVFGVAGSAFLLVGLVVILILAFKKTDGKKAPEDHPVVEGKVIIKVPNEKAKAKPALVGDPHRRLAEMVLNNEGTLTVQTAKGGINVAGMKDLPQEPYLVVNIKGGSKPIPDQALEAFEGVHEVPAISLTVADTAGVGHLRDVAAQEIVLDGEKLNGDECLRVLGERPDLVRLTIRCSSLSDAAVPLLLRMKRLRSLDLTGCSKLTDKGIKELATHPTLGQLHIDPITPEAAALLNRLPFLRHVLLDKVDDAAVTSLSGLTRAAAVVPGYNLSDDGARRLQKALPNAVILHGANPPSEAERSAFQWALDQKAVFTALPNWSEPVKEVPTSAIWLGHLTIPDVVKTGASHLRGIRCIHSFRWFGLKNADEEAEHIAKLDSLLTLGLGWTTLTAKGMKRLTALKRLEGLTLFHVPTITTEVLSYIPKFEQLSGILMNGCPVTDSGLAELAKAKGLQDLTLEYCTGPFTGAGLKHLASLPLLRHLTLRGTPLDENSVGSLKLLTILRVLDVRQTQRVADDIVELHKALPKCAIVWDGGLIVPGMEGEREVKQPK